MTAEERMRITQLQIIDIIDKEFNDFFTMEQLYNHYMSTQEKFDSDEYIEGIIEETLQILVRGGLLFKDRKDFYIKANLVNKPQYKSRFKRKAKKC